MNWFDLIQATLAPVVLISAIGLLNISLTNRYGRIHDRMRRRLQDLDTITYAQIPEEVRKKKIAIAKTQIEILFERAKLSKWSILLMQFSLVTSVIDSILIFVNMTESVQLEIAILLMFGLSVLLILVSAVLTAIEVSKSLKGLQSEVETATKSIDN